MNSQNIVVHEAAHACVAVILTGKPATLVGPAEARDSHTGERGRAACLAADPGEDGRAAFTLAGAAAQLGFELAERTEVALVPQLAQWEPGQIAALLRYGAPAGCRPDVSQVDFDALNATAHGAIQAAFRMGLALQRNPAFPAWCSTVLDCLDAQSRLVIDREAAVALMQGELPLLADQTAGKPIDRLAVGMAAVLSDASGTSWIPVLEAERTALQ